MGNGSWTGSGGLRSGESRGGQGNPRLGGLGDIRRRWEGAVVVAVGQN